MKRWMYYLAIFHQRWGNSQEEMFTSGDLELISSPLPSAVGVILGPSILVGNSLPAMKHNIQKKNYWAILCLCKCDRETIILSYYWCF